MWLIYSRLFLRLILLVVIVFSIFYFYVFSYKYTKNIWFTKNLWVYNIKYITKNKTAPFIFNWKKYFTIDRDITIFWLDKDKCSYIKFWNYKRFICNKQNKFINIIYIDKKNVKLLSSKISFFNNLDIHYTNDINIKYWFRWNDINFLYSNNWDLLYTDDVPNAKFIWYNHEWLFLILKWQIYFLKIIK